MKNKLKRYNDFINESVYSKANISLVDDLIKNNNTTDLKNLRENFYESLEEMLDEFRTSYFSDLCKKENAIPEQDYSEMQNLLGLKGWDFESIKNIFKPDVNEILHSDFFNWVSGHNLDNKTGYCDVYLYFTAKNLGLDENRIYLGGEGWATYDDKDETWIRYKYGYHQTRYGKMYLQQIGWTIEQFEKRAIDYLQEDLEENWDDILCKVQIDKTDSEKRDFINKNIDIKDFSVVEEDRMIIYCKNIADKFNSSFNSKINGEDISSLFFKYLEWLPHDAEFIEGDLVIWGNFEDVARKRRISS